MTEEAGIQPTRSIFRSDAVQRYLQRQEKAVLPRFVSPRTFLYLWILLGLFVVGGFVAWSAQVPVYAAGLSLVVDTNNMPPNFRGDHDVALVAFLPPENLSRLQVGQPLFLQMEPAGERLRRPVIAVEPQIVSPKQAQQRFGLDIREAQAVSQPAAVVIAYLEPIPTGLPAAKYVGSIYQVDVQIGSRRLLSFVPFIERFFE